MRGEGKLLMRLSALISLAIPCLAWADLDWETKSQDVEALSHDKLLAAEYAFANNNDKTITIESLACQCDCVELILKKRTYLPGEKGVLRAFFVFEDRLGSHRKRIYVGTKVGTKKRKSTLRLSAMIWKTVSLDGLTWDEGENQEKEVRIPVPTDLIGDIECIGPVTARKIETATREPSQGLLIAPTSTDASPGSAEVRVPTTHRKHPQLYLIPCFIGKSSNDLAPKDGASTSTNKK